MFRSGVVSAVLSLICCFVAADAGAQSKIVKGIKAAKSASKNAARNTIVRGVVQGVQNIPHVYPSGGGRPVGPIRPQPVGIYKPLPAPKSHLLPKLNIPVNVIKQRAGKVQERFLSYATIESQSIDDSDPQSFPMTEGQRKIASHIYNEIKSFGARMLR